MNTGPIIVVTGGNRGIGFEICRQLSGRGARVVLTARKPEAGAAAVKKLAAQNLATQFHPLDVTATESIAALRDFLERTCGRLDVLINNAGIISEGDAPGLEVDMATVRATLETNALAPLHLSQTLVPLLKRSKSARIVNVSSGMGALSVPLSSRKAPAVFERDEHNPPGTTLEALAALKPAFREGGTITAGNAPGLNSAAAAMVVADESWAERRGVAPVARLVSYGIAAVEPGMFGLGPIPAIRQALDRAGWKLGDIERIEINEAFAAIVIAVVRELGLSNDIVNVEGGAIAHGHPIGATGAILTTRLIHSMRRDGLRRGIVTLCIGGGQGIALAIETIA